MNKVTATRESSLPAGDPNDVLREFAANTAFRAAEWEELTTEDNPFRRPVRPDDLTWLDYSEPMQVANVLKLSGLLGHRMLRNVYDLDALYLPPVSIADVGADHDAFYSDRNRMLSALAKPILEKHLFSFLDDERTALESTTLDALIGHVQDCAEQRRASPGRAFDAVLATKGRREAATFLLLQVSAFLPAMNTAIGRSSLGEYGLAHAGLRPLLSDEYRAWVAAEESYRQLLTGAGLQPATAAYWQLYLNSSLARGNHLLHLSINRENIFGFLGALMYKKIDDAATADRLSVVLAECLGANTSYLDELPVLTGDITSTLVKQLLEPFIGVHGDRVVGDFHRGFADARWFAELWDADLTEQITWADRIEEYQDKAEKIQKHLTDEHIEVDLDTFVESCEETSTTHVHDEHRLVMIEVGQMHFWNNVTHKIELNQGDKLLVPVSRLHGSTVLSGECTYHQPIIPDELLQKIV